MTFREAYAKTLAKEPPTSPIVKDTPSFTQDDMKAYVDAKLEDLKKVMNTRMDQFLKDHNIESAETVTDKITKPVETPEETKEQLKENIEKEGE